MAECSANSLLCKQATGTIRSHFTNREGGKVVDKFLNPGFDTVQLIREHATHP